MSKLNDGRGNLCEKLYFSNYRNAAPDGYKQGEGSVCVYQILISEVKKWSRGSTPAPSRPVADP